MSNLKEKVDWRVFVIAVGIIGTTFTAIWATIDKLREDISSIKVDIATTKNDVGWMRDQWEKMTGQPTVSLTREGTLLERMYEK